MKLKTLFLSLFLLPLSYSFGQTYIPFYGTMADSCNIDTVTKYLQEFEALGVKDFGSTELNNARDWLLDKYASFGYTDVYQHDFVYFGNTLTNIVVTKTGTVYPDQYVIIDGHYDTTTGTGTNDNGTGTSIILELARLLKDVPTEYSIKFVHFTAEEIGLVGSEHYVDEVVIPNNMNIKVLYNIDEVGGVAGMNNNTIVCERDESQPNGNDAASDAKTTELATCMELYSTLNTEISFAYASDYVPFMSNGYVVTGIYEKNETPYAHTQNDSLVYVDIPYVYQITKGSMGAACHFAVAYNDASVDEINSSDLSIFPNPADQVFNIQSDDFTGQHVKVVVCDLTGAIVLNYNYNNFSGKEMLSTSGLLPGNYFVSIEAENTSVHKKLVIQ